MDQSKIKTIQGTGTYNSKMDNALMYTFEVELENGDAGQVVAKTPDRWSVGDEVQFEKKETPYGIKLKLTKPGARRWQPVWSGGFQLLGKWARLTV